MDNKTIEAKLKEIKTFERDGLVSLPRGKIRLKSLTGTSQGHFDGLTETFGNVKDDVLEGILDFTTNVYIELLAQDFVEADHERWEKYLPQALVESAQRLSYEMPDSGKVRELYETLTSNFKESRRFSYRLVVGDLSQALDEVKGRDDYSKEEFTRFTLEVLTQALPYSQGHVQDKWAVFEEQFNAIKDKYFPPVNGNDENGERNGNTINLEYVLGLIKKDPVRRNGIDMQSEQIFSEEVGSIYGMQFRGKKGSNMAKLIFYTGNPYTPIIKTLELSRSLGGNVLFFFESVADVALKNLRDVGYTGDLVDKTKKAKFDIDRFL